MRGYNNQETIFVAYQNYKETIYRLIFFGVLVSLFVQQAIAASYEYNKNNTTAYISTGEANVLANELVYCQPISGCPVDYKLSRLIWDTRNVRVMMAGLRISDKKNYTFNIEGKFGLTEGKGVMDDYDWQYIGFDWSDWSHHEDTSLTELTGLDINMDFNLYAKKKSRLSLLIGYKMETWAWESRGGTYIYSDTANGGYRDVSGSFLPSQLSISYKQDFATPYLGFKYETQLNNWKFNLQYHYSNQVDVTAIDHHHLRDLIFIDNYETGVMSAYKMAIGYQISRNFGVHLKYDAQFYKEVRGSTTYMDSNTGAILGGCNNCSGADNSNQTWSIGASYSY